jgi:hypothetical protein
MASMRSEFTVDMKSSGDIRTSIGSRRMKLHSTLRALAKPAAEPRSKVAKRLDAKLRRQAFTGTGVGMERGKEGGPWGYEREDSKTRRNPRAKQANNGTTGTEVFPESGPGGSNKR